MIANWALKGLSGGANTPVAKRMAEAMKDPEEFARLMRRGSPNRTRLTAREIANRASIAPALAAVQGD